MEAFLVPEPQLFFRGDGQSVSPQAGLLRHGPYETSADAPHRVLRAGTIGTQASMSLLTSFLDTIRGEIPGKKGGEYGSEDLSFPGLRMGSPLKFEIQLDEAFRRTIEPRFVRKLDVEPDRQKRVVMLIEEYQAHLLDLQEGHRPDIVFLPLDPDIIRLCRDPSGDEDKITYQRRTFQNRKSGPAAIFDFHNRIKAIAAHLQQPTQMLRPKTMEFKETQPKSVTAWNFAVGVYYKATGIPWKLAELAPRTCYVGISFYGDFRQPEGTLQTCVAQVYMRRGESQVIRGKPFQWNRQRDGRDVFLQPEEMTRLIGEATELYRRQSPGMAEPERVAVHKRSPFSPGELQGISDAAPFAQAIDAVHIQLDPSFNAYVSGHDYPVVRGTAIASGREGFVFSTGFIPALGTYPGPSTPRPISLKVQEMGSDIRTIASDVIALTKLDWNTSGFCTREPVTIGVPSRVGAVLAEMSDYVGEPPASYRYYM